MVTPENKWNLTCIVDIANISLLMLIPQGVKQQIAVWSHVLSRQYWKKLVRCLSRITPAAFECTSWSSRDWRKRCLRVRSTTNHRLLMCSLLWWDQLPRYQVTTDDLSRIRRMWISTSKICWMWLRMQMPLYEHFLSVGKRRTRLCQMILTTCRFII